MISSLPEKLHGTSSHPSTDNRQTLDPLETTTAAGMDYQPIYPSLEGGPPNQLQLAQGQLPHQNAALTQYMYSTYPSLVPPPTPPSAAPQAAAPSNRRPLAPALVHSSGVS